MAEMTSVSKQAFTKNGCDFVLAAMDEYAKKTSGHQDAKGWRDEDLSKLLPVLEAHFDLLANRFSHPESVEPGSVDVQFVD